MTRAALAGALLAAAWGACSSPGRAPGGPCCLEIKGDDAFRAAARSALDRLRGTRAGGRLLKDLRRAGRRVVLRYARLETWGAAMSPLGDGESLVLWDPGREDPAFPAVVFLHHELLHALHEARGERREGAAEERRALGVGEFSGSRVSENALRRELGLPPREAYGTHGEWRGAGGAGRRGQ